MAPTMVVPVGIALPLRQDIPEGAKIHWLGVSDGRFDNPEYALFVPHDTGPHMVKAVVTLPSGAVMEQAVLFNVKEFDLRDIYPDGIKIEVEDPDFGPVPTAQSMYDRYQGGSIAKLTKIFDHARPIPMFDVWATSIDREVTIEIDCMRPEWASLNEWRVNGVSVGLGPRLERSFDTPQSVEIGVGPPASPRALLMIYEARIVSHESDVDVVGEGAGTTFKVVTTPPGYERYVTWIAGSKYGDATNLLGNGEAFKVAFNNTFGVIDSETLMQHVGVRADNATYDQMLLFPNLGIEERLLEPLYTLDVIDAALCAPDGTMERGLRWGTVPAQLFCSDVERCRSSTAWPGPLAEYLEVFARGRDTIIRGTVFVKDEFARVPSPHCLVCVQVEGESIHQIRSDESGQFKIVIPATNPSGLEPAVVDCEIETAEPRGVWFYGLPDILSAQVRAFAMTH
jgi:hypothetical protein